MDKNTTLQGSGIGVLAVPGCRIISIRFVGLDLVEGQLKVLHDSVQKTGSLIFQRKENMFSLCFEGLFSFVSNINH